MTRTTGPLKTGSLTAAEGKLLRVEPEFIEFSDIQANMKYIQTLTIRNLSPGVKRIRCVPPVSSEFRLLAENQIAIAPGLPISIDVEFLTRKPYDYVDRIIVTAEGVRIEVPLSAKAPCGSVVFDQMIDFGTVKTRRTHQRELTFQNDGSQPATFEIAVPHRHVKLQPQTGKLAPRGQPGDSQRVKVELNVEHPQTVHETVEVKIEGLSTLSAPSRMIDIHGTCIDQALHVFRNEKEVDVVDFGNLYHGLSKVMSVELVNDGPTTVSFNAQVAAAGAHEGMLAASPAETAVKADQPLKLSPFTGQVPAFGRRPLDLTFRPAMVPETKGFICNRKPEKAETFFEYTAKIESEDLGVTIPVRVIGRAVLPSLKVSPDYLQFGECPVNQRRDTVLMLHNAKHNMPLDFEIVRVPHLEVNPMKGRLAPLQNQNIVVAYRPKALGKFEQEMTIKYCGGLYTYTLKCYAHAPVIGGKTVPVKGLEKTGRDFEPEHNFVNPENLKLEANKFRNMQSLTKIMKSDLGGSKNASEALDALMLDLPEPTPYSLSPSAMQEHVRNKQRYNRMIKERRVKRKTVEKAKEAAENPVDIFFENDVDIGLSAGSGLKSPKYSVDLIPADKLNLLRPVDDEGGVQGVTGHRYVHDENKIIKKKFKAAPTTQAEVRECSAALESWQLGLISVGPKVLDFGQMYVRSQMSKSFSIYNDLPQAVLVSMQYETEELSRSNPVSQVIPSAQAAGFDITVCSHLPQSFQRQIVYTINGMHAFKLNIKSEITPVKIKMSRAELHFRFYEDNLDRTLTEALTLTNPGNAPARFTWQGMNASFAVSPAAGVIRAGAACPVEVVFTPPNSGALMESLLTLKIEDGDEQTLRCTGSAPEASCAFGIKRVDFGVLAVGLPQDRTVPVVNNGRTFAVYHVESTAGVIVDGVTVTPMRGRISPEGRIDLNVHMLLDRPAQLETMLTLSIRGGKPIRIPVVATAVVPNIEFLQDEIEFGQLTLGAVETKTVSLKNSSAVEGTLYVNLQPHPEFTLSLSRDDADTFYDASVLQPISAQQYQMAIGGISESSASPTLNSVKTVNLLGALGSSQPQLLDEEDEETNSQMYKITVAPNYSLHMQLTFQPADLGQHYFEFPIVAAGGGKSDGLRKVVHAEALRPRMLFSTTTLDYKTKVVATGMQSAPSVLELALHNADDFPIEWKIDIEPLKKYLGVFTLEPNHGLLAPEQDCLVRGSFTPSEPIEYKTSLSVYISPPRTAQPVRQSSDDDEATLPPDETKPYLSLRLRGHGTVPKLSFDRREIAFPVVPLNIRSRCLFHIINEGYESLEVKYRLPTDNARIPLVINFPEGQQIGITKPRIPVEVLFQASKPISFCAKIEFLDSDTGTYTLPICGTTDNCILTVHQYLHYNIDFYTLEGDPANLKEKEDEKGGDYGPPPSIKTGSLSHQSLAGYGGQETAMAEFLVRWLNNNVLKNQLDNFPQDLISSGGRHLYDMIEFLSGKQVPQQKPRVEGGGTRMDTTASSFRSSDKVGKQKDKEIHRIQTTVQQFELLLNFLKQHGALLSSVRPEHFLSCEQYVRYMQHLHPTGYSRRQAEKGYYPRSIEAWMSCILQAVKIFLLNRVTHKSLKVLPGMTDQIDMPVSGGQISDDIDVPDSTSRLPSAALVAALDHRNLESNVFSPAECILLRWLNFHFKRANNNRFPGRAITNFDSDLQDSIAIGMTILSYVPGCQAMANLKYPCSNHEHYEENAMHIISALQEIGLSFPVQPSDLAAAQPKDMLLFVLFLYQNLPHYVPKTLITFSTMLGQAVTKNIELTNPSKKAITYFVALQGSSDFTIKDNQVKIEPKQTVSFPVEFHSRFSRPVDGQISFTSRREGNVHAAAMVFKMQTRCIGRKPRKTFAVSAVLYEVGTVDVDIDNPFPEDADFSVTLRDVMVCDKDKNPIKSKRLEAFQVDPFHLSTSRLRMKALGSGRLTISFLPFDAPAHFTALVGFFDSKAGEFYCEVAGVSSPPTPQAGTYKLGVKAEEFGSMELILPHKNAQMDRARMWLESHGRGVKFQVPDTITYDVKLSSPFYNAPKQVIVLSSALKSSTEKSLRNSALNAAMAGEKSTKDLLEKSSGPIGAHGNTAKLSLEFRPREPGVYPCTVTLTSDVDIRIYQIEGTGTAPNTHCALTFNTQARKGVTQEIPIINPTERDWIIKPTFAFQGLEFDGPRDFTAKKRQMNGQATTSLYPLTFKPDWVCDVRGQLVLHNAGTNETYEYDLHGVAEEPLAEEHVVIQCEARERTTHTFAVRNYSSQQSTFEVESDLVHISGPSSIVVEGRGAEDYELTFQPLQAGQVTGCIMFRDQQSGHFTWYTVELVTMPPKPQQTLTLTCVVRQAVAVDIQLVNPLDDVVVFEVTLNGEGLLGEAEFVLAPKETATYELVFSPLLPSKTKGTAVFLNDGVGEFWYDLDLIAEPAPPEELPLMECELGRTAVKNVRIENPTGQEVVLKHRSTNRINFRVVQQRIALPPLESSMVTIEYSPSSLGVHEDSQIVFEHPVVGQWVYKVAGIGVPPGEPNKVSVVAQVNRPMSSTITFRNPFLETIHALIVLETKSDRGVFSLLNKKARVQIGPLGTTQIPFSFCPPSMTQHSAEIAVSVVKPNLTWTYAIQGVAEAPADSTLHTFTLQAREQLEAYYNLNLVGLELEPGERIYEQLSLQLEVPPQYRTLASRCFEIELQENPDAAQRPKDKQQVSLKVRFAPLRPFVALCNLVITRRAGGRWRFDVKLEATEPEVDDTILIQSPLNKPASIAFRLCNHTSAYAEFDAFFDAESAYEFTVQPTAGILEPSGTSGTAFVITYKPTEYGKPVQGKLIIQTEEVYWSYLVRGTHPKYSAPVADKPKVVTKLSKDVQNQMAQAQAQRRKKNFIKDNISANAKQGM